MKKTIALFSAVLTLTLAACSVNSSAPGINQSRAPQQNNLTFQSEFFSLQFPVPFTSEEGILRPAQPGAFPTISFSVFANPAPSKDLLTQEKELVQALCGQTDVCPQMIKNEYISFGSFSGVKIHLQTKGRTLGSSEGNSNLYQYTLLLKGNILRFRTSATDLEKPEAVEKQFDQIIATIKEN